MREDEFNQQQQEEQQQLIAKLQRRQRIWDFIAERDRASYIEARDKLHAVLIKLEENLKQQVELWGQINGK